jgi:8-oxo-dGTP diphosphatase
VSVPHPQVGVGGVVVWEDRILLARRAKPPLQGRWTIPGGTVELGETLEEALVREMGEETGLEVEALEVLTVFDWIQREGAEVAFHHVIIDYLCRRVSGEARAASDALEVAWAPPGELARFDLTGKALEVVSRAFRRSRERGLALTGGQE